MEHPGILVAFIRENQNSFYRVAYSYVQDPHTAMDMVQDAIVKALQKYHTLKDPTAVRPWFYRILVNVCLSYLRKYGPSARDVSIEETAELMEAPLEEERQDLYDALDQLDPKLRTIVILHFFEGLTLEETAKITKTNLNTVKSRMYRALALLRTMMEGGKTDGSH